MLLANENSPEIQNMMRRKLESESNVSYARANAGLKADIYLRFGLTQTADKLGSAYKRPLDQQYVSLGIALPILDWGRGKGKVRVARSNRDLVYTQVEQDKTDFELNVRKLVKQFNLQAQRVRIAALYNYWSLYYTLRSLTLFDFEGKAPLTENYDLLID